MMQAIEPRRYCASLPLINTRPGAPVSIYLDFDGYTFVPGAQPGGCVGQTMRPFSLDSDYSTNFSDAEVAFISESVRQVQAYFSPFDVTVTTIQPPTGTYTARIVNSPDVLNPQANVVDDWWNSTHTG